MPTMTSGGLALGSSAPAFDLPDPKGRRHALKDFGEAKALLVIFMCNHCPYVKHLKKAMVAFAAERWKLPELPCWAVAMGTGTTLLLLDPPAWKTEACDHANDGPAEVDKVIAHELVHVYHGQQRPDDEPDAELLAHGEQGAHAEAAEAQPQGPRAGRPDGPPRDRADGAAHAMRAGSATPIRSSAVSERP